MSIPVMPKEYFGKEVKQDKYHKTAPRLWTPEEKAWCLKLREEGYSMEEIAVSVQREVTSVSIQLKRLAKKNDKYNLDHRQDKYAANGEFYNHIKPKSVCDAYCGVNSVWRNIYKVKGTVTNDIDKNIEADYHLDSLKFLCQMYVNNEKFDIVDLDAFGSAANCLELAIQMAKKGLIVTLGEMGHKRFKRLDFVRRVYNINSLEDFTTDNIIAAIQAVGRKFKKNLTVFKKEDYKGISRVWFNVEPLVVTEQWVKED